MSQSFDRSTAMDRLVHVVQELSRARSVEGVQAVVRRAARELANADGATFVLRDGDKCYYADEDAISPLWKGQRFPMAACISGWAMLNAKSVVIPDIYVDERIPHDAYRPTFVKSLAMVPIRREAPIGAIGTYWASVRQPSIEEIDVLQALADSTSVALENAQLYRDLQQKIEMLSLREARIREQRDTLDAFARSLAHDLKQPVHTIRSFADLLAGNEFPDNVKRDYFRFIRDAGSRMTTLVDASLGYVTLDGETVRKDAFSLDGAAHEARANLEPLIQERGAEIEIGPLPSVFASRALTVQVFQQLLANAIGHSKMPVLIQVQGEMVGPMVHVSVRDNGPGVPSEYQSRIFEPFRRLSGEDEHAGLGLAICRKIVEFHGGSITCQSEPGRGAIFSFTLPSEPAVNDAQAA